ncbi:hypothetical protein BYT27DRAFT_7237134 [Phlegmacium glaucopus]|nr:hypothetical protein BYT27DRAFT_7237134 [Phlegmacium glaucopus]
MPGPSNSSVKRRRKSRGKDHNRTQSDTLLVPVQPQLNQDLPTTNTVQEPVPPTDYESNSPSPTSPPYIETLSPLPYQLQNSKEAFSLNDHVPRAVEEAMFKQPFIHDPGNGPRVRIARDFISSFFAQPPALDDPLCAEFAQEEVLQMLCTILPEETALVLWYNKSRARSRVCPACQRLYRLGDVLPGHIEEELRKDRPLPPQLLREQEISGLCSPVCFILASFNYPGAIKSAWGRMEDEMDDLTWDLLNGPGEGAAPGDTGRTLGMVVKMTRLHDLGLAQLCFDSDETSFEEVSEEMTSLSIT